MPDDTSAYGLWFLVAINSAIFIFWLFAGSSGWIRGHEGHETRMACELAGS